MIQSFVTLVLIIFCGTQIYTKQRIDPCNNKITYENKNQVDYGPLIVQEVKGRITDPQQVSIANVCVAVFAEKGHKLITTTKSNAEGSFSLHNLLPGRYRLIVKTDPLCAANIPLQVVKRLKKKLVIDVYMKPRGYDSCSYAELRTL